MKKITLLILLGLSSQVFSQTLPSQRGNLLTKSDSVLYIYFEKGNNPNIMEYKHTTVRIYKNGIYEKTEKDCGYHKILEKMVCPPPLYSIDIFTFIGKTIDGYNVKQFETFKRRELKKINVITINELKEFLKENYVERNPKEYIPSGLHPDNIGGSWGPDPSGSVSYWNQLKNIYIVEPNPGRKNYYTLTEVRQKVDIE
jgi:hypothetical protein